MTPLAEDVAPLRALQPDRQTVIMAILNITPDSFSDGGVSYQDRLKKDTKGNRSHQASKDNRSFDNDGRRPRSSRPPNTSDISDSRSGKSFNSGDVRGTTSNRFSNTSQDPRSNRGSRFYSNSPISSGTASNEPTPVDPAEVEAMYSALLPFFRSGAHILDIGGQSTAPGRPQVTLQEEIDRVIPVVMLAAEDRRQLPDGEPKFAISVDTYRAAVAEAAINAGADIINDVSAGRLDDAMLSTVGRLGKTICLMHMRGTPKTMNEFTDYPDGLIPTIAAELLERIEAAQEASIRRWRIILDPGIGFAKTLEQNLEILRRFAELRDWPGLRGMPWLVGSSRKRFIGTVTGVSRPALRDWGTSATVSAAVAAGADIVRVHDVKGMKQVVHMSDAIWRGYKGKDGGESQN